MNDSMEPKSYHPTAIKTSTGRKIYVAVNGFVLCLLAAICLLPFIHVLAVSFSSNVYVDAGAVSFWPVGFTSQSYTYLLDKKVFWTAFRVSVIRLVLGTSINMVVMSLCAYALSKPSHKFGGRTFYAWFFFITMLVNGGLIPNYMVVTMVGLRNTIWALVLPCAVQVYNMILLLNFFRQVPESLEEAAFLDGANHFQTLIHIYLPLSLPALATITLFCMVFHWNSWFDGQLYTDTTNLRPLQTYLRQTLIGQDFAFADGDEISAYADISDRSLRCAQIIIATIPILCVYPFLQKYFVTGLSLGGVKE